MNKPKYQIGDRILQTNLIVRGKMVLTNGRERYFLQIGESDNSLVLSEDDILIESNYKLDLTEWLDD